MTIGQRLKEERESKNIERKTIAEKINIDISSLSKIENGKQMPSAKIITDICLTFDLNLYYVLTGLENNFLTAEEQKIIKGYRNCTDKEKGRIEEIIDSSESNKTKIIKEGNL